MLLGVASRGGGVGGTDCSLPTAASRLAVQIFKGSYGKSRPQKTELLPHMQPPAGPIPIPQKPAGGYFGLPPAAAALA